MDWGLIKKKNFRLFLMGNMSSVFGDIMLDVALPLFVLQITKSAGMFGSTLALGVLPKLFLGFAAGALVDRTDKKKLVVFLDLIRGIMMFLLFAILIMGKLDIWVVYISMIILSVCDIFFAPAYISILPAIIKGEELVKGNAINKSMMDVVKIVAAVAAAGIFGIWGIGAIFIIDGITFIASAFVEGMMDVHIPKSEGGGIPNLLDEIAQGIRISFRSLKIGSLVVNAGVTHLFLTPFMIIGIPYVLKEMINAPDGYYGIVRAFEVVGALSAGVIVGFVSEKVKPDKGINLGIIGMILSACLFIPMGIPSVMEFMKMNNMIALVYLAFINFCIYFSFGFYGVYFVSVYQRKMPIEYIGRFITVLLTVISLAQLIGFKIMGMLFDSGSIMVAVLALIGGMIIKIIVHVPYMRSHEGYEQISLDV